MSELDELLESELRAGNLDTSGRFTLSLSAALQKMAAFELANPDWWILKVIQAAVAGGAKELRIDFSGSETRFLFEPEEAWTLDLLEAALVRAETEELPGLDHLKRALWSVSLAGGRPFRLELRAHPEKLVFLGEPRRLPGNGKQTCLAVSHRSAQEGYRLLDRVLDSPNLTRLRQVLKERAHTCTIPLFVDSIRHDRLEWGPPPRSQRVCQVLALGCVPVEGANFTARPGRLEAMGIQLLGVKKQQVGAAFLVSLCGFQGSARKRWQPASTPSRFHWVHHGVMVDSQVLGANSSLAVDVYTEVGQLPLTVGGFGVVDCSERRTRVTHCCQAIFPLLEELRITSGALGSVNLSNRIRGLGLVVLGIGTILYGGILLIGGGFALYMADHARDHAVTRDLEDEVLRLRSEWRSLSGGDDYHRTGGRTLK